MRLCDVLERIDVQSDALDADLIVISTSSLRKLLSGLTHYNLTIFDVPKDCPKNAILSNAVKERAQEAQGVWDDELLVELSGARVYFQSHDDCYLHVQCYDLEFPKEVFKRALQISAGTVLRKKTRGEIEEIPKAVINALWPENSAIKIDRGKTGLKKQRLKIGVATTKDVWGKGEQGPISRVVEYDYATGLWHFHQSGLS